MTDSVWAYQDLANQAMAELKAQGLAVIPLEMGDAGTLLTWAESWGGEVPQTLNATALYAPGAQAARSCHFSLLMMTEGALPGVQGHEVWTAFCRHLSARLSPVDLFLEPSTDRLTLRYSQILMSGCAPRITQVADELSYLAQFLLPAVHQIRLDFWTPDHARAAIDGVVDQMCGVGVSS